MQAVHYIHKNKPKINVNEVVQGSPFILQYLSKRKEAVLPSEISDKMEISTARIAVILNSLDKKGLINREINKNDRRQILVTLTAEGEEAAKKLVQEAEYHIIQMLQNLGEHDAGEFVRILNKLAGITGKSS